MPKPDEKIDPRVVDSERNMTPDEKLAQALKLHRWGRRLAEAGVRGQYPEWSDEEVRVEVHRRMLGGTGRTIAPHG
ncbi:MAG: hypothetical protein ACR2NU_16810 [Aeoliella sp.]